MKFEWRKIKEEKYHRGVYDWVNYQELPPKTWCCDKLKEALDDNFLKFSCYNNAVQISKPSWEGSTEEINIERCPWCGEKIDAKELPSLKKVIKTKKVIKNVDEIVSTNYEVDND